MVPLRGKCAANQDETVVLNETAGLRPLNTFHYVSITEGIRNYPLERQLTNILFADGDLTIISAIGFTGDELNIKLIDSAEYGDRLMAYAIAINAYYIFPYWGSVYSTSSANSSFTIDIPVYPPGVIVLLYSGYQRPSLGENPYAYTIELSFPQ
jgi:hypothetical protein